VGKKKEKKGGGGSSSFLQVVFNGGLFFKVEGKEKGIESKGTPTSIDSHERLRKKG